MHCVIRPDMWSWCLSGLEQIRGSSADFVLCCFVLGRCIVLHLCVGAGQDRGLWLHQAVGVQHCQPEGQADHTPTLGRT